MDSPLSISATASTDKTHSLQIYEKWLWNRSTGEKEKKNEAYKWKEMHWHALKSINTVS